MEFSLEELFRRNEEEPRFDELLLRENELRLLELFDLRKLPASKRLTANTLVAKTTVRMSLMESFIAKVPCEREVVLSNTLPSETLHRLLQRNSENTPRFP